MASTPIPEGKYVTIASGLRLHYHEQGTGSTVIFIHGSGPGASGYSNFKQNYPVIAKAGHRVLVLDLPGYGLSDKPAEQEYINDFFIETLHGFIQSLHLKHFTLLGNSLGGAIALGYALAHPKDVARLILMAPGGVEEREAYFQMEGIKKMMPLFAAGPLTQASMRELLTLQLYDSRLVTDDIINERVATCALQPRTVLSTMRVPNYTERLGEIKCPVLGFWGMNDQFNPVTGAAKIAAGCPHATMTLVNHCGHWVQVEHRDYFNQACITFLSNT